MHPGDGITFFIWQIEIMEDVLWKALVKAVESSIRGNNTALAIEIAEEHRASG